MTARVVEPLAGPLDAVVTVPGSKSLTNRALVTAALAAGRSRLQGALFADDTEAMAESLNRLGIAVQGAPEREEFTVDGCAGHVPPGPASVDVRQSGTTARFVLPLVALGRGDYQVDGSAGLRARPMGPLLDALRALGARVDDEGHAGHLPVVVSPAADGADRREVAVSGDISSQFLSGLLLSGPCRPGGLRVEITTELVSRPYVEMTMAVMRAFGAWPLWVDDHIVEVAPTGYRSTDFRVEPDASAASYFFAAAAILGGRVRIDGLVAQSWQGDLGFVDVLAQMGVYVERTASGTTVTGPPAGELHGVDVDLADLSDTAQTLAAVAVFASSPTRVRGIGFIRGKETDRIAAVVTELRRCGLDAEAEPDGFVVRPGVPRATTIETYDDHRMAMSFALLGLRVPGIAIADPDCVAKTFPGFWDALDRLRAGHG